LPDWARSSAVLLSVWTSSILAGTALEQVQAEREASKSRKAEAKAAKSAAAAEVSEPGTAAAAPELPPAGPAKRSRRKPAVAPADAPVE